MINVMLFDYWRSSASYRVRIALNLAQISYQLIYCITIKICGPSGAQPSRSGASVGHRRSPA